MQTSLEIYFRDHLAGAAFAIDLLKTLQSHHTQEPVGAFAARLLLEIESDRQVLQRLAAEIQTGSNVIKETVAKLGEKAARIKLHKFSKGDFGTFEALEALSLGILGKQALWTALLALNDARLRSADFPALLQRAREQYAEVEGRRIEVAGIALQGAGA